MGRKLCSMLKGKTLLGIVNKLLKTKSLTTSPSNVTSRNFPTHNLNFDWWSRWWDWIQAIFLNLFYFKMTYRDSALYRSWTVTSLIFTISPPRFFISFSGPRGLVEPATICRDFLSIDEKQWAEVKICFSLIIEPEQCNFVLSSFTIETVHGSCKNYLINQ